MAADPNPDPSSDAEHTPDDEPLEGDDPNDVENAWAAEIERRRREVREGKVIPIAGEDFLRELRARTSSR
jgi:hypothetical protein